MESNNICIKNIYHMLCYAYKELRDLELNSTDFEEFNSFYDLLAELFCRSLSKLIKRGVHKSYIETQDELAMVRGRINFQESIRQITLLRNKLICDFDEFSADNIYNQIINNTIKVLINSDKVTNSMRRKVKSVLFKFPQTSEIDLNNFRWGKLKYITHNKHYKNIMRICEIIHKSNILNENENYQDNLGINDDCLPKIYEKFLLNYFKRFKKEHKNLKIDFTTKAKKVAWLGLSGNVEYMPQMVTDVCLMYPNEDKPKKILIIEAKFNKKILVEHCGKLTVNTKHLYQLQSYVVNSKIKKVKVSGLLLYAETSDFTLKEPIKFVINENNFCVDCLNLSQDFTIIKAKLDNIAINFVQKE